MIRKSSQTALKTLHQFYTLHCLHHWEMYYFLPSIIKCLIMISKFWFFLRFFERFRNKCLYRLKEGNSLTELFVQFALLKYLKILEERIIVPRHLFQNTFSCWKWRTVPNLKCVFDDIIMTRDPQTRTSRDCSPC